MTEQEFRIERDSMGELKVPVNAFYGAQTQRAVENFPISGIPMSRSFIRALGLVKSACAHVNANNGSLDNDIAEAIQKAAEAVAGGEFDDHFPIDVFQTGSGTSSNMNVNEVIAHLASDSLGKAVHPNDHVNQGQSSNDVIPTAIHVSACLEIQERLLPALEHLASTIEHKARENRETVTTGRTHLMDAMPIRLEQSLGGWASQVRQGMERIEASLPRLQQLVQGGTAVGTGVNTPHEFGPEVSRRLAEMTSIPFTPKPDYFEGLSAQDAAVEMSGQLKVIAVSLMKIANDLRLMNSGPLAGLAEIALPALQPGSSIMPGKVNPVIPESVCMLSAQVIGNDAAITVGGQAGNFQLNVMLPMIAHNLLQSIELLANGSHVLADKAIEGFTVNHDVLNKALAYNPILVTALNPVIGYEKGAAIAKAAYAAGRPIIDVAEEMTDLSREDLEKLLDPLLLTQGG